MGHHEWKGAVVFLCDENNVYLIKRSEKMPTHGGQIAFVGGHKKPDELDPWTVAQREYEEETSLSRNDLEFLGYLPVVMTARLQPIIPVMAKVKMAPEAFIEQAISNGEWDEIIAYPWKYLMEESNWEYAWRHGYTKSPVMFHTIKAHTFISNRSSLHPHLLWGATASMIWELLRLYFKPLPGTY